MKKLSFIILFVFCSIMASGQVDGYSMGYGLGMYDKGKMALCEGEYDDAFDYFTEGVKYNPINYEGIGVCYELGFGVAIDHDEAWDAYAKGANKGNYACKEHIRRIKNNGYWSKSIRSTFLNNLRNSMNMQGFTGGSSSGSYGGSNSSGGSSSVYSTCRICGGSGVCTSCGGRGGEWRETGYYTGSNTKTWINCGSCNGNKRCFNCHGTGRQ